MLEIISYDKFKNERKYGYKKYRNGVENNMHTLGFVKYVHTIELDRGERRKDTVRDICEGRGWKDGVVVYYVRIGDCALYYMDIYFKEA